MEDEQIQELLKEYANEIKITPRLSKRIVLNSRIQYYSFLKASWIAVPTFILIGAIFWPAGATALAVRRVENALTDVRHMKVVAIVTDERPESGRPAFQELYSNGKWRIDTFGGLLVPRTYLVNEGKEYEYSPKSNLLIIDALKDRLKIDCKTVLDYAVSKTDLGSIDIKRFRKVESRPPFQGKEVYALILERAEGEYHAEILVDKNSNLPLRATVLYNAHALSKVVMDFSYEKLPEELFLPKFRNAVVVDLQKEWPTLRNRWSKILDTIQDTELRDVSVSSDGELYVAYSVKSGDMSYLPTEITPSDGTCYIKLPVTYREREMAIHGNLFDKKFTEVGVWVPLEPKTMSDKVQWKVGYATHIYGMADRKPDKWKLLSQPKRFIGTLPFYAPVIDRKNFTQEFPAIKAAVRANWYRDKRLYMDELRWRRKEYQLAYNWFPRYARKFHVKPLVECLRHLGRDEEASDTEKRLMQIQ